jgi:hypothetical protein
VSDIRRITLLALVAGLLGACEVNQLYTASHTNIGINAAVKPDMTEGSLMVGYQRDFVTLVPKSVPDTEAPGNRDVMAALVCTDLVVSGIWLNKYVEYVATGKAARDFAAKLKGSSASQFFDCYQDPQAAANKGGQ